MNQVIWGHVDPWWDDSYKELDYKYYATNFNSDDFHRWKRLGFDRFNLNGMLYDMRNPMPNFTKDFFSLHNWNDVGISFFRMQFMDFLPNHKDHFVTYKEKFKIEDPMTIWRSIVFLEDWKPGHYFEVNQKANTSWKAGDWVAWQYDTEHAAGNIGLEDRYTLQITGWIDEN